MAQKKKQFRNDAEIERWMRLVRIAHKMGILPADKVARIEAIPGWTWEIASA